MTARTQHAVLSYEKKSHNLFMRISAAAAKYSGVRNIFSRWLLDAFLFCGFTLKILTCVCMPQSAIDLPTKHRNSYRHYS